MTMNRQATDVVDVHSIKELCEDYKKNNGIDSKIYDKLDVKKGLRNKDGTGVLAGVTKICNVHGYVINEGEKSPIDGELIYRGINVKDIVENCRKERRYGFEETIYLLLFGELPTKEKLEKFEDLMFELRKLPPQFFDDMILKAPSKSIMNKLGRSVLALYSYDDSAEDESLDSELLKALQLIARMPNIMVKAMQVQSRYFQDGSMFLHPLVKGEGTAQSILSAIRPDRKYTEDEALLLDTCLILHAEHGGGNNSTFTCRVLTSSGTDAYAAYSGAIGSLKGHKHGGANKKVSQMVSFLKAGIKNWEDEEEVAEFLGKMIRKEEGDGSGLIYGMGHAVYTKSDPRAILLKDSARKLMQGTEYEAEFKLLELVEKLTPEAFAKNKSTSKDICANVDLYSGLIYKMLGIPSNLFTPLFACSRMAGWCAHRMEEKFCNNKIIRPAYKAISKEFEYIPLEERE